MSNYRIIKNGLVLTMDKDSSCGVFNVVVKDGKIIEVDQTGKLTDEYIGQNYEGAEIIDATNKILMPGFIDPNLNSSYIFSRTFFKRNAYDTLSSNVSLDLLDNYFKNPKNVEELYLLLLSSYSQSLLNGDTTAVEVSNYVSKEVYSELLEETERVKQDVMYCACDATLHDYLTSKKKKHYVNLGREDNVNTYSLNALKKYLDNDHTMVYTDVLCSEKAVNEIKSSFGKSPVKIFNDYGILGEDVFFVNPLYLTESDIELVLDNKASVIFNTSDYIKLGKNKMDVQNLIDSGVNVSFGTGYLGSDLLSELRSFASAFYFPKFKYSTLTEGITSRASASIGLNAGSIEKNRQADILFFNTAGLRNIVRIPELDSEKVSEFIVENLTTKDIDMVMKNGDIVVSGGALLFEPIEDLESRSRELLEEVYRVGNYFEFKEKHMMKKRVDELRLDKDGKEKKSFDDVMVEDTEKSSAADDSFRIIGVKKLDEYRTEKPLFEYQRKKNVFITEVTSFDKGMMIFTERQPENGKTYEQHKGSEELVSDKKSTRTEKQSKNESGEIKKEKLRFGFSDE